MSTASTSLKKKSHLPEFTVTALVITLFLIFIDEGNYSFSGLTDIGNILALGFYFLAMVVGQVLVFAVMERFLSEKLSLTWALILGTFLGAVGMALDLQLVDERRAKAIILKKGGGLKDDALNKVSYVRWG